MRNFNVFITIPTHQTYFKKDRKRKRKEKGKGVVELWLLFSNVSGGLGLLRLLKFCFFVGKETSVATSQF